MYIYHALINTLSAHMIHINLNMIFCTYVEHGPTKRTDMKYYTEKQTNTHTTQTLFFSVVTRSVIQNEKSSADIFWILGPVQRTADSKLLLGDLQHIL